MTVGSTPIPELTKADAVDTGLLRKAFGSFATGVTVITVGGPNPHGMTANSFAAVSLQPPLALVCIDQQAIMHERIVLGRFGISVLSSGQESLARHFADLRRPLGAAQFEGVEYEVGELTEAPLITGAIAHFECELSHIMDGGDHTIFVSRVLAFGSVKGAPEDGLLFVRGAFGRVALNRNGRGRDSGPSADASSRARARGDDGGEPGDRR